MSLTFAAAEIGVKLVSDCCCCCWCCCCAADSRFWTKDRWQSFPKCVILQNPLLIFSYSYLYICLRLGLSCFNCIFQQLARLANFNNWMENNWKSEGQTRAQPQLTFRWELSVNFDRRIKLKNESNKQILKCPYSSDFSTYRTVSNGFEYSLKWLHLYTKLIYTMQTQQTAI